MPDLFKYSDFEFCGTLADENPKCWFINDGNKENVPIPKSQVRSMRRIDCTDDWILTIPLWLAQEKGIV